MPLILASDLLRLPVASVETNSRVGSIHTMLIDTDKSLVIGFLISLGLFSKPKYLSISDIASIDREGIVIKSLAMLVAPHEVVRAKKIIDDGIKILRQLVHTESGRRIGKVNDILIDTQSGTITKYYVHGILSDRIIPAEKIITIDKKGLVVEDEEPVKAEPAAAAAA